jgi:hypothetical protein
VSSKDSKKRKADLEKFLSLLKEKRLEKQQKEKEKLALVSPQIIEEKPREPISLSEKKSSEKIVKKLPKKQSDSAVSQISISNEETAVLDAIVLTSDLQSNVDISPITSPKKPIISSKNDYLSIVYIYDIFAKDKKSFNRTKRLFYYYLNKLPLSKNVWKTKSTIAVSPSLEKTMDSFFSRFGSRLIVYKICAHTIEQLE